MKKILFIAYKSPHPIDYGYAIRTFNIAKALTQKYEVDLLFLNAGTVNQGHVKVLERTFNKVIPFSFFKTRFILNGFFGVPSRLPLQVNYFFFPEVKEWVEGHAKEYDLIFCSTIRTLEYVRGLETKKVIDLIDDLTLSYGEFYPLASFPWKAAYFIDWLRLKDYHKAYLGEFNRIFITSPFDAKHLVKHYPHFDASVSLLPNGIREGLFANSFADNPEEERIIFFGKMDYFPNRDAVLFFIREVFPELRRRFPYLEFLIIGKNPPGKLQRLFQRNVRMLGFVDDPYAYLKSAKVVITPIRAGAGIQNKILEAMALKKANVISHIARRGIVGEDGKHFLVAQNKKEWIEKISTLLEDASFRRRIGEAGYDLVRKNYRWDIIGNQLLAEIDQVLNDQ